MGGEETGCATRQAVSYRVHKSSPDKAGLVPLSDLLRASWRLPMARTNRSYAIGSARWIAKLDSTMFGEGGTCRVSEERAVAQGPTKSVCGVRLGIGETPTSPLSIPAGAAASSYRALVYHLGLLFRLFVEQEQKPPRKISSYEPPGAWVVPSFPGVLNTLTHLYGRFNHARISEIKWLSHMHGRTVQGAVFEQEPWKRGWLQTRGLSCIRGER